MNGEDGCVVEILARQFQPITELFRRQAARQQAIEKSSQRLTRGLAPVPLFQTRQRLDDAAAYAVAQFRRRRFGKSHHQNVRRLQIPLQQQA